ncbi:MAG: hypothetical protein RQ745_06540 [Longimicrobiales bacterium]|nr:hypothetical protein [Longimicrobiales bacterium]
MSDSSLPTPRGPVTEALLVALSLAAVYLLVRISPSLAAGAFHDDGVYLAVGKSLAEGEGYRSLYAIGEPVHAKYPPVLPALYALLWFLLGDLTPVHGAAIALSLVVTAAAAGGVWWLARARLGLGLPTALVFALGPFLLEASVQYFNLAISEPYFILLWALALILFHALAGDPEHPDGVPLPGRVSQDALSVLLGVTLAAAVLVRSQGIVLVPAVLLALVLMRVRWKHVAVSTAAAVLPVVAWKLWHARALAGGPVGTQPDEGAYVAWVPVGAPGEVFRFLVDLFDSQLRMYGTYMPPHLSGSWAVGMALWLAFLGLVFAGIVRSRREHPDLVLTALCSASVIFLWPWWQDRFVLAMLPFLGLLAGTEVERWARRCPPTARRAGYAALAVIVGLVLMRQVEIRRTANAGEDGREFFFHPTYYLQANTAYLIAASRWMEANTPPDADLLAPHPVGVWLYTGRRVVNATPAVPDVGPTVWDVPGRFLARRVAEDEPDLLAIWALNEAIARDVSVVQQRCPDALEYLGFTSEYTQVAFYRIHAGDRCLDDSFLQPARAELEREAAERTGSGRGR